MVMIHVYSQRQIHHLNCAVLGAQEKNGGGLFPCPLFRRPVYVSRYPTYFHISVLGFVNLTYRLPFFSLISSLPYSLPSFCFSVFFSLSFSTFVVINQFILLLSAFFLVIFFITLLFFKSVCFLIICNFYTLYTTDKSTCVRLQAFTYVYFRVLCSFSN